MKKIMWAVVLIIVIVFGVYTYIVRPASAPSESVQSATTEIKPETSSTAVYRISQAESKAQFEINELLYGKPKLVIGTTTEIAGDIAITGSNVEIGEMKINARTWVTDSSSRNGALDRAILHAEDPANEFIVFKPTSTDFTGTSTASMSFNVTGDLTISGVTKQATFAVTAQVAGDTLTGTASTMVKRSDYNLKIPNLSFIANVDEQFPVKIMIVAHKVQ